MNFEGEYDKNSGQDIERGRDEGVWTDTTTQPNRYEDFIQGLEGRADYQKGEEIEILDVGCSKGVAAEYFAESLEEEYGVNVNVVGLDIEEGAVRSASERLSEAYQGEAQDMKFEDDRFDIVTSKTLLSRIPGTDQTEALQEIDRVVDSEGYAAVQVDPEGHQEMARGQSYVMTGEELSAVGEATAENGENFSDYPMRDVLDEFRWDNFIEEDTQETVAETNPDTEGFLGATRDVADNYEDQTESGKDDDIIVA